MSRKLAKAVIKLKQGETIALKFPDLRVTVERTESDVYLISQERYRNGDWYQFKSCVKTLKELFSNSVVSFVNSNFFIFYSPYQLLFVSIHKTLPT